MEASLTTDNDSPKDRLIEEVLERLDNMGDLPIFSASVSRIQMVGSDPEVDAMDLAIEVLKDANLSTKLLKIANSTYFNRGNKVGALSRAIVVLGFDLVKSSVTTMKLVESYKHEEPDLALNNMLIKAYMSAGFIKELAEVAGFKKPEENYVCGLLHNLGEIVIAAVMPESYDEMQYLKNAGNLSWLDIQKRVLGVPLHVVGRAVAERWEFPEGVTESMKPFAGRVKGTIKQGKEQNRALASLGAELMDILYSDDPVSKKTFAEISKALAKVTGTKPDTVMDCLDTAFRQSCDLAEDYGLDRKCLRVNVERLDSQSDPLHEEMARRLLTYTYDEPELPEDIFDYDEDDGYEAAPLEVEEEAEFTAAAGDVADSGKMLTIIQQLTVLIGQKAELNAIFAKVLEGMVEGAGFDRAMLCLITPDRMWYSCRLIHGKKSEALKRLFQDRRLNKQTDLFSRTIVEGNEVLVSDINALRWSSLLNTETKKQLDVESFLVAAVRVRGKPLGFFYGDKLLQKSLINSEQYRAFLQLVAQAQLAMQVR